MGKKSKRKRKRTASPASTAAPEKSAPVQPTATSKKKPGKKKRATGKRGGASSKAATVADAFDSSPTNAPLPRKLVPWLLGILALTFAVYLPSLSNDLTNWDDPALIIDNPLIRSLDAENIKRIFTEHYFGNYQPLHILSYAIEYHFWELDPRGYHAVSLVWHLLLTALVMIFTWQISGNRLVTVAATLLFAVHPMHVESVAWATERKDNLYATFFVGALIFYMKYVLGAHAKKYYFLALFMMLLAIFSKAMAASLAPVLLLVDLFVRRPVTWKLFAEKLPFFGLAMLFGMISVTVAHSTEQIDVSDRFTFLDRLFFASHNFLAYWGKLLVPIKLSAFHQYPSKAGGSLPSIYYAAMPAAAVVIAAAVVTIRRTRKVVFGFFFFSMTVFLVLMLIPIGPTVYSERYTYLPSIGMNYLMGLGLLWITGPLAARRSSALRPVALAVFAAYVAWLSAGTYQRCKVWENSGTLWDDVIAQYPTASLPLNNRANYLGKELAAEAAGRGDQKEAERLLKLALADYDAAIASAPRFDRPYCNRGIVLAMQGRLKEALESLNTALELTSDYEDAQLNRAIVLAQLGRFDEALADFDKVIETSPGESDHYFNRGIARMESGNPEGAEEDLSRVLEEKPEHSGALYHRARARHALGRTEEARADLKRAMELGAKSDPAFREALLGKEG